MIELRKQLLKKSDNKPVNQCQNSACEQKTTTEKLKFGSNKKLGLKRTMNGLVKPLKKMRSKKSKKKNKNQSRIAAYLKTTSEKAKFCSDAVFSLYSKNIAKKLHAAKPLAFSLNFLFRRDQNHCSN